MARLHEPSPAIPSGRWMSVIAWTVIAGIFALGGTAIAGGMGWI